MQNANATCDVTASLAPAVPHYLSLTRFCALNGARHFHQLSFLVGSLTQNHGVPSAAAVYRRVISNYYLH